MTYENGTVLEPDKIIVFPDQSESKGLYVSRVEVAAELDDFSSATRFDPFSDIALLELSTRLDLNTYTPACLAQNTERFEGKEAEALVLRDYSRQEGWTLMNLHTPIMEIEYCFMWLKELGIDAFNLHESDLFTFTYFVPGLLCSVKENNEL